MYAREQDSADKRIRDNSVELRGSRIVASGEIARQVWLARRGQRRREPKLERVAEAREPRVQALHLDRSRRRGDAEHLATLDPGWNDRAHASLYRARSSST